MIQLSDFYGYSMYTISSDTLSVSVMSLGATVTKLAYLGRNVVVSLKTPDDYLQDTSYLGAIVGRYANRIAGGRFPLNGETVQVPWYDFPNNRTGGYTPMQGSREAVIIAEGIHMLNPLLFDPIRDRATGIYVAPRTRIITPGDRIIHPEQVRVARRMIRNYQGRGNSLRDTILRAESVNAGEQKYIVPNKPNASVHIDSFHDYELCILAKYLRQIPQFASDLDDAFIAEHGLTVLMDVVRSLPPLDTPYVPRDSIVREFVGGSIFQY